MAEVIKNNYFMLLLVLVLLNARILVIYVDDPENVVIIKTIAYTLDLDNGPVEVKHYLDSCAEPEKIGIQGLSVHGDNSSTPILIDVPRRLIALESMPSRAPPPYPFVQAQNPPTST